MELKSILKKREEGYVPGSLARHDRRVSISPKRRIRTFTKGDDEPLTDDALAEAMKNLDLSHRNDMKAVAKSKAKRKSTSPKFRSKGKTKLATSPRRKAKSKKFKKAPSIKRKKAADSKKRIKTK